MSEAEDLNTQPEGENPSDSENKSDDSWKNSLPEEMRSSTLVQEAKSIEDVIKTTLEAQAMIGNSIRIPSEHASDEDQAAFREKLTEIGMIPKAEAAAYLRPENPDQYRVNEPPTDAEQLGLTQGDIDALKSRAHELGLSNDQFNDYANRYFQDRRDTYESQRKQFEEADLALKGVWGEDAFDAKKQQALAAIRRFGGNELVEKFGSSPDPDVLMAFAKIGQNFEEQGMGDLSQPQYVPETREEAAIKLDEINRNPDHPFNLGLSRVGREAFEAASAEVMRLRRLSMGLSAQASDDMFEG